MTVKNGMVTHDNLLVLTEDGKFFVGKKSVFNVEYNSIKQHEHRQIYIGDLN